MIPNGDLHGTHWVLSWLITWSRALREERAIRVRISSWILHSSSFLAMYLWVSWLTCLNFRSIIYNHLMQRADSLEKTLMLGKIEGRRRRGRQRMGRLDGITDSMDMSLGGLRELVMDSGCCSSWGGQESETTERLNWTELEGLLFSVCLLLSICYPYQAQWSLVSQIHLSSAPEYVCLLFGY